MFTILGDITGGTPRGVATWRLIKTTNTPRAAAAIATSTPTASSHPREPARGVDEEARDELEEDLFTFAGRFLCRVVEPCGII